MWVAAPNLHGIAKVMPLALRKRSWEDHVTPHSRKQYSYDDLDLDCCLDVAGSTGSQRKSQRGRCASMPECQSDIGTCQEKCDRDRRKDEAPSNYGVEKCQLDEMARPISGPSQSSMPEGIPALDQESVKAPNNSSTPSDLDLEETFVCSNSYKDYSKMSPKEDPKVSIDMAEALMQQNQQLTVVKETDFWEGNNTSKEASSEPRADEDKSVAIQVACNVEPSDVLSTGKEILDPEPEPYPYLLGGNSDKHKDSHTKLDTILEVFFPDTVNERSDQVTADQLDSPASSDLEHVESAVESGDLQKEVFQDSPGTLSKPECLGNHQNGIVHELPLDSESYSESMTKLDGWITDHRTSPNMDRSKESEREPKPQENPVRFRTRKSSREEKERDRSQLDSMVLLIMKLDLLDQEIENALSSTSSPKDTPTVKRRLISQVDSASLDGSLSVSLCSLASPHHQSTSSLSSAQNRTSTTLLEKDKAEIEAKEACTWLRATGFPQYAQLYEDGQFPLEISSVTRDHDFLDRDAIEALCRRLNTLNKCAMMKLEITRQRKRSEDSDEDEPCAISGRWTFQRDSKRWSRLDQLDLDVFSPSAGDTISTSRSQDQRLPGGHLLRERVSASAESVLTDLSEQPEVRSLHSVGSNSRKGSRSVTVPSSPANTNSNVATAATTRANSVASVCSSGTSGANDDSLSDGIPSPLEHGQFTFESRSFSAGTGASKSTRSKAKSFLKRMENLRLRSSSTSKRKKKGTATQGRLEISGPVLKEGLDEERLRQLNCVDIALLDRTRIYNRSVSYSTQTSSGSTGSSQSETSSGSAVSTPSPVTRARSHSMAAVSTKRVGMYLEGFDPFSLVQESENLDRVNDGKTAEPTMTNENNRRNRKRVDKRQVQDKQMEEGGVIYFYLPDGHKPGTFPKSLADGVLMERGNGVNNCMPRKDSATSLDNRLSFYDNVPFPEMGDAEEVEGEEEEPKIEDVLESVTGLQQLVTAWTESGHGEEEEEEEEEEGDSDSALDSASPCPSSPLQNCLLEAENGSDQESTGNPQDDVVSARERRDSGVGPSLTQANSRPQKLRWPSFQNSHKPSVLSSALQLGCQSVLQMNLLQKYSLLKLTALLEKHTPTNKHGFSWAVPKFMKRTKVRDWKDRSVFGVPLQVNVQRTGQPLPQGIQQAMRYLRNHGLDQVGLFRKSGVKSRIQALRQMNESCGAEGGGVSYEGQSAYDVADMLKQYFRDLPEPLLTSKLSESFLQIYQFIPEDQRMKAVQAAVCLLPDESREVLHMLLCFLSDVAANVGENQMTCTNLAVCLAPSLFHLNTARRDASSPRVMSRKNTLGKPDQKDLNENLAATHCLTHMIQECRRLFQIPKEVSRCRNSYTEQALVPLRMEDLQDNVQGYRNLVKENVEALLKETKEKFKGYESCATPEHAELACKKVHDGWSLRQWKVCVDVPAGPDDVLQRVVREQERWDDDLLENRVIETLDANTDVYQYVRNNMAPHPPTDYVVLRSWATDLPKGAYAFVCLSVEHEGAPALGVRANVLTSRYLIEPCGSNKSRLTYISRTDCRGRCPEWYNKLYGHLCVSELVRIRDSFACTLDK